VARVASLRGAESARNATMRKISEACAKIGRRRPTSQMAEITGLSLSSIDKLVVSAGAATRHGDDWSEEDLEVLARTDLTTKEKAELVGRTFAATHAKLRRLKGTLG
jgi:hypothetical protein